MSLWSKVRAIASTLVGLRWCTPHKRVGHVSRAITENCIWASPLGNTQGYANAGIPFPHFSLWKIKRTHKGVWRRKSIIKIPSSIKLKARQANIPIYKDFKRQTKKKERAGNIFVLLVCLPMKSTFNYSHSSSYFYFIFVFYILRIYITGWCPYDYMSLSKLFSRFITRKIENIYMKCEISVTWTFEKKKLLLESGKHFTINLTSLSEISLAWSSPWKDLNSQSEDI